MSRVFCIPGIIFLVCALVLSFLTSISLPYLPALDIARTHFGNGALEAGQQSMTQLRVSVSLSFSSQFIDYSDSLEYGEWRDMRTFYAP